MYQSMMTDPEMSSYIYVKPEDEDEDGSYNQNHDW